MIHVKVSHINNNVLVELVYPGDNVSLKRIKIYVMAYQLPAGPH